MRILALLSGTSADAIDVAVADCDLDGDTLTMRPLEFDEVCWPAELRERILAVTHGAAFDGAAFTRLDRDLGCAFAHAASVMIDRAGPVDVVVSHGQTLHHLVDGRVTLGTMQLGDPSWIAEATGAPVVSHLRHADIAAGGAGAPLATVWDALWLPTLPVRAAALNLGGISNLQVPVADGMLGFDSGPASCLLDAVVARASGASCDRDGALAAAGSVSDAVLARLLAHPYLALPAPKSTGRETFDLSVVDAAGIAELPLEDAAATLTLFTAITVADALHGAAPDVAAVVASGGGVRNHALMEALRARLRERNVTLHASSEFGLDPDAKEALLFALLGALFWHGVPVQLSPTGPSRIAGRLTPSPAGLPPALPAHCAQTATLARQPGGLCALCSDAGPVHPQHGAATGSAHVARLRLQAAPTAP